MIRSMTGFGRAEGALGAARLVVEVRSVNSRHLEVRARLPRDLAALEARVKAVVAEVLLRGQVDVSIRLPEGGAAAEVAMDLDIAKRYVDAASALANAGAEGPLAVDALIALPGVTTIREAALAPEELEGPLVETVRAAAEACAAMRAREGEALASELAGRLAALEPVLDAIEAKNADVRAQSRTRLERRIAQLAPDVELDPGRLEQEVVLHADRLDVTEETVRFRSHLGQFHATLDSDGSVGRKLEFLLQELGREVNTIGSKAQDADIAHRVVELKTELEKVREQVLNVE